VATNLINWSSNHTFQAACMYQPATIDELRRIVSTAEKDHAIGSRHSFNDIADSPALINLDQMDQSISLDRDASTVTISAAMRYGTLAIALEQTGYALHNMASLPHITVGGAVATATHGSGDASGNLASAVAAFVIVTGDGDVLQVSRKDPGFDGMVVGIGALGVVTRLTLDIEPSYLVKQEVFEGLAWETVFDQFDTVSSGADSVSLFTDFGDIVNQVWLKFRVNPDHTIERFDHFLGGRRIIEKKNPVVTFSAEQCTEQLGIPGPWLDRLPHVRMEGVSDHGDQLQTEYIVSRAFAVPALQSIKTLSAAILPHLWIAEIRTVAADNLWLSSSYQTDSVCIHFSWKNDPDSVHRLLPIVEEALAPFAPRPHWGKLFTATSRDLEGRYPRFNDFRDLAIRLDPRGAFRNDFLNRCLFD